MMQYFHLQNKATNTIEEYFTKILWELDRHLKRQWHQSAKLLNADLTIPIQARKRRMSRGSVLLFIPKWARLTKRQKLLSEGFIPTMIASKRLDSSRNNLLVFQKISRIISNILLISRCKFLQFRIIQMINIRLFPALLRVVLSIRFLTISRAAGSCSSILCNDDPLSVQIVAAWLQVATRVPVIRLNEESESIRLYKYNNKKNDGLSDFIAARPSPLPARSIPSGRSACEARIVEPLSK